MTMADDRRRHAAASDETPLGIICGGGSLPYAVADAARRYGRRVVLLGLRNAADHPSIANYPHHWIRLGQFGRCIRLLRAEGCRDVVLIGSVLRPTLTQLWPDLGAISNFPLIVRSFRGGDGHLLAGVAQIFEQHGFRLLGAHEVAPDILMPMGLIAQRQPSERDWADIARGLAFLQAVGPFDVGQGVVVADNRILAVEASEGTDEMLSKLAEWRRAGKIRSAAGTGVLIKAPKPDQDYRIDLPSIGPKTVERSAAAGLAGIAAVAGGAIVAEAERIAAAADRARLFVVGVKAVGSVP
jgi:DUF1009 family protein